MGAERYSKENSRKGLEGVPCSEYGLGLKGTFYCSNPWKPCLVFRDACRGLIRSDQLLHLR